MDRDILIKLGVIERVVDKDLFLQLFSDEPFVYKLFMDKFKEFLDDDYFDITERQLILLRFLRNNYPLEITREIIQFVQNCEFKKDYERIVLEWNLSAADFIRQYNLYEYDAQDFCKSKEDLIKSKMSNPIKPISGPIPPPNQNEFAQESLDLIKELTNLLLEDMGGNPPPQDDGGDDSDEGNV